VVPQQLLQQYYRDVIAAGTLHRPCVLFYYKMTRSARLLSARCSFNGLPSVSTQAPISGVSPDNHKLWTLRPKPTGPLEGQQLLSLISTGSQNGKYPF